MAICRICTLCLVGSALGFAGLLCDGFPDDGQICQPITSSQPIRTTRTHTTSIVECHFESIPWHAVVVTPMEGPLHQAAPCIFGEVDRWGGEGLCADTGRSNQGECDCSEGEEEAGGRGEQHATPHLLQCCNAVLLLLLLWSVMKVGEWPVRARSSLVRREGDALLLQCCCRE